MGQLDPQRRRETLSTERYLPVKG
ncbi:MAG: hypothetical protein QOH42_2488, partial [Blastocatellia bacterium]|nr:hypothetical protein [Blastocatellia bacterium]